MSPCAVADRARLAGALLVFLACHVAAQPTQPAALDAGDASRVGCAADQPVVHPGDSLVVRAWAVDAQGQPLKAVSWRWNAPVGVLKGEAVAVWQFGGARLPRSGSVVLATVDGALSGRSLLRCDVEVVLADPPAHAVDEGRGGEVSARAFLVTGQDAVPGYGLYSYVLLRAPSVDPTERARHVQAVAAYLLLIRPAAEMERYRRRSQMNLAALPVKRAVDLPEEPLGWPDALKLAERVLLDYDYDRAESLLADFEIRGAGSGPYLVAALGRAAEGRRSGLVMDMSRVVPPLVVDWVRSFRSLATAERSWGSDAVVKLALGTRNAVAVAALNMPDVRASLSQWVRVVDVR